MTTSISVGASTQGRLRPLNVRHDLQAVADLIEICFNETLDPDGRSYLREMRTAGQYGTLTQLANSLADKTPDGGAYGYVWEENGAVVGNVSLIPAQSESERFYLIANVAVVPQLRGHGIGRQLTEAAIEHVRQRGLSSVWLQVRDDNPVAHRLYLRLGFVEQVRRTTWQGLEPGSSVFDLVNHPARLVTPRSAAHWPEQRAWLQRLYPDALAWHLPIDWNVLPPGLLGGLHRLFSFNFPQHWSASANGQLQAVVTHFGAQTYTEPLLLAAPAEPDPEAIECLLASVRVQLAKKHLTINCPDGYAAEAIESAGFKKQQTLIWMRLGLR